jgi:hypothetical protein
MLYTMMQHLFGLKHTIDGSTITWFKIKKLLHPSTGWSFLFHKLFSEMKKVRIKASID